MSGFIGFEDLGSDFDTAPVVKGLPPTLESASGCKSEKASPVKTWTEKCTKCSGSGHYYAPSSLGHQKCTKCKGTGALVFKSSPEARAKNRVKGAERKQKAIEAHVDRFAAEHPAIHAWWSEGGAGEHLNFAQSLRETVKKYGRLSERQLGAALNCIAKYEEAQRLAKANLEVAAKASEGLDMSKVEEAMSRAKSNGIKKPKMRLALGEDDSMTLSLAGPNSRWNGSIYVVQYCGTYLGRITDNVFIPSREGSSLGIESIISALAKPMDSAVAYGRRFGDCSCCGRELTNHVSIEMGIGPICASKFFG